MTKLLSDTQRLARVGLLLLFGPWWVTPQPVYAGSCNWDYLSGGYCGEWFTLIWDGASSSCGSQNHEERKLCANTACMSQCLGALAEEPIDSCNSNEWSSWYGFRCGEIPDPEG